MKLNKLQKKLEENNLRIFTSLDVQRFLNISGTSAQKILERYTKKGIVERVKKGSYILKSNPPSAFYTANSLYRPSYISFESALSFYSIIPESVFTVISATPKATRNFEALGKEFQYLKIKKKAFAGYHVKKIYGEKVSIAEPEKSLVDYLYFVSLGRKKKPDRIDVSGISRKKIEKYALLFKRKGLKEIIEKYI